MDICTVRQSLQQTLIDGHMSRPERDAIAALLQDLMNEPGRLRQVRAAAFEIAREGLAGHSPETVLQWLEEVQRAIESAQPQPTHCRCLFAPKDPCADEICGLLKDAEDSADLCVFTITDDCIVDAVEAAHRRGVRVRIFTDDDKALDRGSDAARLARAGIPVRKDRDPAHMHHKFAIIDERYLLTGSYNWTRSAADENAENIIILDHPGACRQFRREFDRLWNNRGA